MQAQQIEPIIATPIQALASIIEKNPVMQTVGFKHDLYNRWDQDIFAELYNYAQAELDRYYAEMQSSFSIQQALQLIMDNYLTAKTEPFAGHPLGRFVRQTIPQ